MNRGLQTTPERTAKKPILDKMMLKDWCYRITIDGVGPQIAQFEEWDDHHVIIKLLMFQPYQGTSVQSEYDLFEVDRFKMKTVRKDRIIVVEFSGYKIEDKEHNIWSLRERPQ